ncbi:hypothetical protein M9Y10_016835 [Tritrichomonas musculus]|uniref:Uncharacterized protein n=1 Tax=Tritrichomonas musculus TaxID=1915356 RepID=A0ABR2HXD4_9EUKA
MNEKIRIRRTAAPVKTPRITAQSSNGHISPNQHIPFVSQQKNILPIIPFSFDNSKIISINHSFHLFTDNVASFLSHNGCIGSYRAQVSQQTTELERLFNSFYQAILKYSSQQNYKSNPSIRSTGTSFLKNWQAFAMSILELKRLGPGMITQSINAHFNSINSSLKTVMTNGTSKSNVHDQSYRNGRVLQNQLNILKASADGFLEQSNNSDELKRLSAEMKEFSRLLNDTFAREFTQCGIAQNEVVRLRSKCYTACCDIIHGLKNSYLFQTNLNKLLQLLVGFQNNLKDILEKFNLPLNYLVAIDFDSPPLSGNQNVDDDEEEEEEKEKEIPISFDENLSLPDFIRDSQKKSNSFIRNQQSGDQFFGILNNKVIDLMSEISKRKNIESDEQNAIKNEFERLKRENKLLMQERQVFMNEADDLKIECDNLKQSINQMKADMKSNESNLSNRYEKLQKALKQISKTHDEIDDDTLISKAIEIQNETINNLADLIEKEQKMKKILKSEDIISEAERILKELTQANSKLNDENESASLYQEKEKKLKNILSQFSNLDSPIDVANEILDSFKKLKHIVNCTSLSEGVDSIYMLTTDLKESLFHILNLPEKSDKNLKDALNLVNSIENEINSAQKVMKQAMNDESSTTSLHQTAENMSNIYLRYSKNFNTILSIFGQIKIENKKEIDIMAVESIQKVHHIIDDFIQKLKQISGAFSNVHGSQFDLIGQLLNSIESKINHDKEAINELQKLCLEVESTLSSYNNESSNSKQFSANVTKSIRTLLKKLPQKESIKSEKENIEKLNKILKNIESKLLKILNENCEENDRQKNINHLLAKTEERITKDNEFFSSLKKKLNLSNEANYDEILLKISSKKNSMNDNKEELEKMFDSVFELVPVTSRSEPSHYIPEFCNAFISLHNSVLSLKPFASILNQIFSEFDCKLQSFKPSSQSFHFIKNQIYNLHSALNNLSPSKVNSLVFLILSRFVALTSSFTAAISAASFNDGDPNMKEEFFQMQMELCKNKKVM